jgi:hypothetical protein
MLKNFEIDKQYICGQSVHEYVDCLSNRENPTADDLILILKGEDRRRVSTSSRDHPQFAELRNNLEAQGYIKTVRNSWNGDMVVKSFKLNGRLFKKGQSFLCGAAQCRHPHPRVTGPVIVLRPPLLYHQVKYLYEL